MLARASTRVDARASSGGRRASRAATRAGVERAGVASSAESAEVEARRRRQRAHRKRNRERNKLAVRDEVEGLVNAFLALAVDVKEEAGGEGGAARGAEDVDWTALPAEADPLGTNKRGGDARGLRKRNQVAAFAAHLRRLVEEDEKGVIQTVVDFGCGTGNVVLACAAIFPELRFVGIDLNRTSVDILNRRIQDSGLTNVSARVGLIEESETLDSADVALACHVCGEATDFVMNQAIERRIPFIIAPCCVGKVQEGGMRSLDRMRNDLISLEKPTIQRPRSRLMRKAGFDFASYMSAAALADWSGHQGVDASDENEPLARLPRRAKIAIEIDRGEFAREREYEVSLHKMPAQSGIRDDVIVGVPKELRAT